MLPVLLGVCLNKSDKQNDKSDVITKIPMLFQWIVKLITAEHDIGERSYLANRFQDEPEI